MSLLNPGRSGRGLRSLLRACGFLGLLGVSAVVATDVIGFIVVDDHDPISETISKLAVGRYGWIQDLGITLFGVGAAACAAGLVAWRTGGTAWKAGVAALVLLAMDLVAIAQYNQYAGELGQNATVHRVLVYALYALFSLAALLLARGLGEAGRRWMITSAAAFVVWSVLAPLLFLVPTAWDGAYERLVSCVLLGWIVIVSRLLIVEGLGNRPVGRCLTCRRST